MVKVGIIGATGYAGKELVNILAGHEKVKISYLASHSYQGMKYSDVYPSFYGIVDDELKEDDIVKAANESDVIFLTLPHSLSSQLVTKEIIKDKIVIDLGADFRLKDKNVYEAWYKCEHKGESLLNEAVYGLPEIHREEIKKAHLIANPGCYTTCSILTLYPLVKNHLIKTESIIIDAKSGVSGAGRGAKIDNLFCEVNESVKAYSVTTHRHTPEIEQELSYAAGNDIKLTFTPHLIPMQRGILATCYASLISGVTEKDIKMAYEEAYNNEVFVRLTPYLPQTRFTKGTNFVDISFKVDERTGRIVAIGALDNLIKGAAGQAVENMNIALGYDESLSLKRIALI